jgi:hypothetical protein
VETSSLEGNTLAHVGALVSRVCILELLNTYGMLRGSMDIKNADGDTPVDVAIKYGAGPQRGLCIEYLSAFSISKASSSASLARMREVPGQLPGVTAAVDTALNRRYDDEPFIAQPAFPEEQFARMAI